MKYPWIASLLLLGISLTGCAAVAPNTATPTPAAVGFNVQAKQLATVFISPTPDEAERRATQLAAPPTVMMPTQAPTPTATVYVGLFLGESLTEPLPNVNAEQFAELAPPTLTPIVTRCAVPISIETFGTAWQAEPRLNSIGCPIEGVIPFLGSAQFFEQGVMYSRPGVQLWAILPGAPGRYWVINAGNTPEAGNVNAPPGLLAPSVTFAAMWLTTEGLRDALGYGLLPENEAELFIQRLEGGYLLYDGSSGQTFVLLPGDQIYGPY